MGTPLPAAALVVIDESSDDEVVIVSIPLAKKRGRPSGVDSASLIRGLRRDGGHASGLKIVQSPRSVAKKRGRPSGIDSASWELIQELQQPDGVQIVQNPRRKARRKSPLLEREIQDRKLAHILQQEEERKSLRTRREVGDREKNDRAVALMFQQDEEEYSRKKRPFLEKEQVLDSLMPFQLQAVNYVKSKAKEMHEKSLQQVERRIVSLNFVPQDLRHCLEYIRHDAPIVIHLTRITLASLARDTHYRNLFETKTSGGSKSESMRMKWEDAMFGRSYCAATTCKPFDRPKYGALNYSGDLQGVKSARRYGDLVLILHQHVRHRATFFNKDTGNFVSTATLATNEYYSHILNGYNDADLTAVLNVCKSARIGGARSHCTSYKEVQIHGPVCLATDIQALSVPGRERTADAQLKKEVLVFQQMADCNILWQEDLLNPQDGSP